MASFDCGPEALARLQAGVAVSRRSSSPVAVALGGASQRSLVRTLALRAWRMRTGWTGRAGSVSASWRSTHGCPLSRRGSALPPVRRRVGIAQDGLIYLLGKDIGGRGSRCAAVVRRASFPVRLLDRLRRTCQSGEGRLMCPPPLWLRWSL